MAQLPAIRLSQVALDKATRYSDQIRPLCRIKSPALTTSCVFAGLPLDLAELCAGLLASVVDDLVAVSKLPRSDFERTKRKQRILSATEEPACSALRIAIACSPTNGRAAVEHWDHICEKYERGKLAWLLGMETDTAWRYGREIEKRSK